MASFDYQGIVDGVVVKLLAKFGKAVTIEVPEDSGVWVKGFNAVTQRDYWQNSGDASIVYTEPAGQTTEYTPNAITVDFSVDDLPDTKIDNIAKVYVIEPGVVVPEKDYKLVDGTETFYIEMIDIVKPADVVLIYRLFVRV